MAGFIDKLLLKAFTGRPCPSCGKPIESSAKVERAAALITVVCGHCGHRINAEEFTRGSEPEEAYPDNPAPEPPQERLRHFQTADGDFAIDIPKTGRSGCLLPFAILWLGFCGLVFPMPLLEGWQFEGEPPNPVFFSLFALVFVGIGVGLLYAGLKMKYSRHRIFLDARRLLYQSEFFGRRRTIQMNVEDVLDVNQKVFYTQNYQPVRGIEITDSKGKKIKFGSQLFENDKRWIVQRLRQELRSRGNKHLKMLVKC